MKIAKGFLYCFLILSLLASTAFGSPAAAGDAGDNFAIVSLVAISTNDSIWFTDNEWNGTAFTDINEGEFLWIADADYPAGTVISVSSTNGSSPTVNIGSISGSGIDLGASNETLVALLEQPATSMTSATFLSGISSDLAGSGFSLTGTGMTSGTNFIDFASVAIDYDGFKYTGSRSDQETYATYLPVIMNTSNWQTEISDGTLILPISTTSFTLAGEPSPPVITVSTATLIDFSYYEGAGPSSEQSFTVSGADLTADITLTPPSDYEISTATGGLFSATNPITLTQSGGSVGETTIYVRLKAGLSAATYNSENITASSTDASNQTVTCSGWVSHAPMVASSYVEDFTNSEATSSYLDGSFTGNDGITWNYIHARDENNDANNSGIDGNALMLPAQTDNIYSGTIAGGIANFYVRLYKGFTGSGDRQVELFINDVSKGTSTVFDDYNEHVFTVNDINVSGDIVIKLVNCATKQIIIDDISWSTYEVPLSITLASFTAEAKNGAIQLAWETASETNNARFVIYRNDEAIGNVEGAGTTSEPHQYEFTDNTVVPGVTYTYVLVDVDYANCETRYEGSAVSVTSGSNMLAEDFTVGAAYPNPFNPLTVIPLELARETTIDARLFDLSGHEIKALMNGSISAGSHTLRIEASDLTSGIYVVKVAIGNTVNIRKIALVK